jgi:hypothetical protein
MLKVYCVAKANKGTAFLHVETYPKNWQLNEVIAEAMRLWNEDPDGEQVFIISNEDGVPLVSLSRFSDDKEVCVMMDLKTGEVTRHRCRYILDSEGAWIGTDIIPMS